MLPYHTANSKKQNVLVCLKTPPNLSGIGLEINSGELSKVRTFLDQKCTTFGNCLTQPFKEGGLTKFEAYSFFQKNCTFSNYDFSELRRSCEPRF